MQGPTPNKGSEFEWTAAAEMMSTSAIDWDVRDTEYASIVALLPSDSRSQAAMPWLASYAQSAGHSPPRALLDTLTAAASGPLLPSRLLELPVVASTAERDPDFYPSLLRQCLSRGTSRSLRQFCQLLLVMAAAHTLPKASTTAKWPAPISDESLGSAIKNAPSLFDACAVMCACAAVTPLASVVGHDDVLPPASFMLAAAKEFVLRWMPYICSSIDATSTPLVAHAVLICYALHRKDLVDAPAGPTANCWAALAFPTISPATAASSPPTWHSILSLGCMIRAWLALRGAIPSAASLLQHMVTAMKHLDAPDSIAAGGGSNASIEREALAASDAAASGKGGVGTASVGHLRDAVSSFVAETVRIIVSHGHSSHSLARTLSTSGQPLLDTLAVSFLRQAAAVFPTQCAPPARHATASLRNYQVASTWASRFHTERLLPASSLSASSPSALSFSSTTTPVPIGVTSRPLRFHRAPALLASTAASAILVAKECLAAMRANAAAVSLEASGRPDSGRWSAELQRVVVYLVAQSIRLFIGSQGREAHLLLAALECLDIIVHCYDMEVPLVLIEEVGLLRRPQESASAIINKLWIPSSTCPLTSAAALAAAADGTTKRGVYQDAQLHQQLRPRVATLLAQLGHLVALTQHQPVASRFNAQAPKTLVGWVPCSISGPPTTTSVGGTSKSINAGVEHNDEKNGSSDSDAILDAISLTQASCLDFLNAVLLETVSNGAASAPGAQAGVTPSAGGAAGNAGTWAAVNVPATAALAQRVEWIGSACSSLPTTFLQ